MVAKFTRKDFLEAIFADYYREHRGFILVKSFKRGDPKMSTRYFPNIDILAKEHYGDERDVYFGLCPRERMKAEKEHIRYIVALWADLDIGAEGHEDKQIYFEGPQEAARAIRSFPRAPSIIVESGRGAHLYWLLKEVTEVEDQEKVEGILKKIAETLKTDTDPSVDAVLRLPETVNTKIPGKPVNCDVKFVNTNFRYSLQDFENIAERVVARPSAPKAAPPPPPPPPPPRQEEIVSPPSFSEDDTMDRAYEGARDGIDDSLIVDETIIDELIDDISMTATAINEPVSSVESSRVAIESGPRYAPSGPSRPAPAPPPAPSAPPASPRTAAVSTPPVSPIGTSSSALQRLSSEGVEIEVSLIGNYEPIIGVLVGNENGLIEVESGSDLYTIPLSSVAFIRSNTM